MNAPRLKKLSELSPFRQLFTVIAVCAALGVPVWAVLVMAADAKINSKYATDADMETLESELSREVANLAESVDRNTTQVRDTLEAVDSFGLMVMDVQIVNIEETLARLDRKDGALSQEEEALYREKQRALEDMERRRQQLYDKVLNRPP